MGDLTANLSRSEFECQCEYSDCTRTPVDFDLPPILQDCIDHFAHLEHGRSLQFKRIACHINSGYRCPKHDHDITDGKSSGVHQTGMACDFWMEYVSGDGTRKHVDDDEVADYLEHRYPGQFGIGRYDGRTHMDTRNDGAARWDKR